MPNITEEKWIEMLEKKADGTYIIKYPKVKSKSGITFDEHLAENATEAHNGISILNDNITVTVGNNGDFSTINEALNYLTTKYPAYKSGGNVKATIKLLSGFVMSEQVLVRGLDLGWIEIVGEDAKTTIKRSALTINFTIDDYGFNSFPAFGVSKGGTLPIIGQLFVMDDSGNRANRHGIMAVDNSRASILTECGVQNAGSYGIYAIRSSIINAYGANASNAGTYGIYANGASIINAWGADASNAGTYGICATQSSIINAYGADASGAGGRGVYANQVSTINAIAVNARKGEVDSAEDIYVSNGSIIKISSTGSNQTIGGTNQDTNILTRNGIIFSDKNDNTPRREAATLHRKNKDENGIYTRLEWYRADGTLFKTSELEGESPQYTTRRVKFYAENGQTLVEEIVYRLTYDENGELISEVIRA